MMRWTSSDLKVFLKKKVCGHLSVTGPEVALDDHLVLLLIPSCNDEVILRADEPQELLKPAQRGEMVERIKGSLPVKYKYT